MNSTRVYVMDICSGVGLLTEMICNSDTKKMETVKTELLAALGCSWQLLSIPRLPNIYDAWLFLIPGASR